jgi:hypothetical protein
MLVVETIARIRREHFGRGKGIKAIARELRVSRKVVRKVIRSGATAFTYERREQPHPKVGPFLGRLIKVAAPGHRDEDPDQGRAAVQLPSPDELDAPRRPGCQATALNHYRHE